jgi:hypothetical protein
MYWLPIFFIVSQLLSSIHLNDDMIRERICTNKVDESSKATSTEKFFEFIGNGIYNLGSWITSGGEKIYYHTNGTTVESLYPIGATVTIAGQKITYIGNGIWFTNKAIAVIKAIYCS